MFISRLCQISRFIVVCFVFASCMIGPNYKTPLVKMPNEFAVAKEEDSSLLHLSKWWEVFDDPYLNEFIQIAILSNYDLKIAIEKIEESRFKYRIERSKVWPEVDFVASAIRYGVSKNTSDSSDYNSFQIGFDALWELDIFGKNRRLKQAAFNEVYAEKENMRDVYISVLSEVAKNYVDIRALQSLCELTEKELKLQTEIYSLVGSRSSTGLNSEITLKEREAVLYPLKEQLISYQSMLKDAIYNLASILGKYPEDILDKFSFSYPIPDAKNKISKPIPSDVMRNRADVRKAERLLAASNERVGAAICDYFPSFSLNGCLELDSEKLYKLFSQKSFGWSLGSIMNWPIITFGRIKSQVNVSKSKQKQALLVYEKTIIDAFKDVESSLTAYLNEYKNLKTIEEELLVFKGKKDLYKDKYTSGLNSIIVYLDQDAKLTQVQMKEVSSKRYLMHNLIAFYKALGGDW